MVIQSVLRDWTSRLDHLRRAAATDEAGAEWLWRIRIRILDYLVRRYGEVRRSGEVTTPDAEPVEALVEPPVEDVLAADLELPAERPVPVPLPTIDHPPKLEPQLAPLLRNLRECNDKRREVEGYRPQVDEVWEWWSQTFGEQKGTSH